MDCKIGFDVVVVGGGPAGVQAAVSASTEGFDTVLVEPGRVGGQISASPHLENLAGYPYGVPGGLFASALENQLHRLDVPIVRERATALRLCPATGARAVVCETQALLGKAVVIATGKRFSRLSIQGTDHECVEYGPRSAMAYGPEARGKRIAVVGGGNSAGQTITYLGRRAERLYVVSGSRGMRTSAYLTAIIQGMSSVSVIGGRLVEITPEGTRCGLSTEERETIHRLDRVFICAGMAPNTEWLPPSIVLSDGAVETYHDFQTPFPGVFAVGDVRRGGGGRVPIALGEGAAVQTPLWDYLRGSK